MASLALASGLWAFTSPQAVAQAPKANGGERRVALVIGNAAYKTAPLKNPVNDAQALTASLKGLGFEVMSRENTDLRELIEAMRQFSIRAQDASVRLVFYAGHGIQARGRNYLLPVDTEIDSEDEVPAKSADANELLDRLGQLKHGVNIVILDACRTNPFAGGTITLPDGSRRRYRGVANNGLAKMDAPIGTLIAFATAPGGVALDNPNSKFSVYTKHLLANIETSGLPVEQLFKQVRLGVAKETGRTQVPWESSSLMGDFCFKPGSGGACK
jgi:uncharacterized caspase-like protein